MEEVLRQEGKLKLKRDELARLALRIGGLVRSVRDALDPTEPDPAMLRTSIAAEQAFELDKLRTDYLAVQGEISEIRQYLGRR